MAKYWITNPEGAKALVEGAEQRDYWTKVRGWHETSEPGPDEQVHVVNENEGVGPGRLPYASLEAGMSARGWKPGPPPEPVDLTKDPEFRDQPQPVVEPVKTSAPASGTTSKEK